MMRKIRERMSEKVHHYSHKKYWKMRDEVVLASEGKSKKPKFVILYYLYKIRKSDAFNMASMGTNLNGQNAIFKTPPILPHGLHGIIVNHKAVIGENCTIWQYVTIAEKEGKAPIIGDNCFIGTGAVILGGIRIGDNVNVGAGTVVVKDVPDNCTVVSAENRIIQH